MRKIENGIVEISKSYQTRLAPPSRLRGVCLTEWHLFIKIHRVIKKCFQLSFWFLIRKWHPRHKFSRVDNFPKFLALYKYIYTIDFEQWKFYCSETLKIEILMHIYIANKKCKLHFFLFSITISILIVKIYRF